MRSDRATVAGMSISSGSSVSWRPPESPSPRSPDATPTPARSGRTAAGHRRRLRRGAGRAGHVDRRRRHRVRRPRRHHGDEPDQRPSAGRDQRPHRWRDRCQDISTTQVSLQPQYADNSVIAGYRASNSIQVKIRKLDKASQALAAIVGPAGDATRINSVSYSIEDDSKLVRDAGRAFDDAKDRAGQYAELSGLSLGKGDLDPEAPSGGPPRPRCRCRCRAGRWPPRCRCSRASRPSASRLPRCGSSPRRRWLCPATSDSGVAPDRTVAQSRAAAPPRLRLVLVDLRVQRADER